MNLDIRERLKMIFLIKLRMKMLYVSTRENTFNDLLFDSQKLNNFVFDKINQFEVFQNQCLSLRIYLFPFYEKMIEKSRLNKDMDFPFRTS